MTMPVFALTDELVFPDPSLAEPDGLLAVGGDLRPERLLLAYAHGIFPWNGEDEPLLWWSPAPRAVLVPGEVTVSRSLAKAIRRRPYRITLDLSFEAVLAGCAETPRPGQDRTWITPGIRAAFTDLHRRGLAHSVEAWDGERLVGGLYGLALGSMFCGESMFARADDASKIAFVALAEQLRRWEFTMIDCQVETAHLRRFGAAPVEREEFMRRVSAAVARPWRIGVWALDEDLAGRPDGGPRRRTAPPPVLWKMTRETGERRRRRRGATTDVSEGIGEAARGVDGTEGTGGPRAGAAREDGGAQETGEEARDADGTEGAGRARAGGAREEGTGERGAAGDEMAEETGDRGGEEVTEGTGGPRAGAAREGGGAQETGEEARDADGTEGAGRARAGGAREEGTGEPGAAGDEMVEETGDTAGDDLAKKTGHRGDGADGSELAEGAGGRGSGAAGDGAASGP